MDKIWQAGAVAQVLNTELPKNIANDYSFTGLFTDSRHTVAGGLFVPLCGERFNAHKFVELALQGGAAASLWSKREAGEISVPEAYRDRIIYVDSGLQAYLLLSGYYMHYCGVKVLGITGSVGKTTTKDFAKAILGQKYCVGATLANHNNEVGFAETLLSLSQESEWAVVEMGMRARGEIERLAKIAQPQVSIITTIGESHLERLGTRREIALAKAELLDYSSKDGVAILPADSDFYELLCEHALGKRVSFAVNNAEADWHLLAAEEKIRLGERSENSAMRRLTCGQTVRFVCPEGEKELFLPAPGRHNCANMLAALAAGYEVGISVEEAAQGLASCLLTGKRLEMEIAPDGTVLIDDSYNAAPSSVKAALELLAKLPELLASESQLTSCQTQKRQRIAVLGDMLELGGNERQMHEELGAICANGGVELLIGVGELSRYTVRHAQERGLKAVWAADFEQALEKLNALRHPGDYLLVKASHSINLSALAQKIRANYVV